MNLGKQAADSVMRKQHADLRADFSPANPPCNVTDWWHGSVKGDPRRAVVLKSRLIGYTDLRRH